MLCNNLPSAFYGYPDFYLLNVWNTNHRKKLCANNKKKILLVFRSHRKYAKYAKNFVLYFGAKFHVSDA